MVYEVPLRSSMRTRLRDGVADDGKLYTLESVLAGQVFIGQVAADTEELLDVARRAFVAEIRLGRSRGAEFGLARCRLLTCGWLTHGALRPQEAVFLCVSDLALRSETGAPRLLPMGTDVGLPKWTFAPERSAVRTRRYSPYNGHRRRPDLGREVIEAGSVLTFHPPDAGGGGADRAVVLARLERGVGEHRSDGLGMLWLEPEPLLHDIVRPWTSLQPQLSEGQPSLPDSPLLAWIVEKEQAAALRDDRFARAREMGRRFAMIPRAQWAELFTLVDLDGGTSRLNRYLADGVRQHVWRHHRAPLIEALGTEDPGAAELLRLIAQHARHASVGRNR